MRYLAAILALFSITSCDLFSSKKVKSLVELTPELTAEVSEPTLFDAEIANPFEGKASSLKGYQLTKTPMIADPITAKGHMYSLEENGNISAFHLKDKKTAWSYKLLGDHRITHFGGGITHNQGTLLVTGGTRFLTILDAISGHEIMRKEFPDIIRTKPVLVNNNVVLVQTVSNQLFAYDIQKAGIVWQHEGLFETLSSGNHIPPLVYGNTVLVSYSSGQIFGLDAASGQEKWASTVSLDQNIGLPSFDAAALTCKPVVEGHYAYLASAAGKIVKIDLDTGQINWQASAHDILSLAQIGNHIFITTNAKQIAALNTATGKVVWVGKLDLQENKRKSKASLLLAPFPTNTNGQKEINVISSLGEVYSFSLNDGVLQPIPRVIKITPGVTYYASSCCTGGLYMTTSRSVIFLQ